jgi:CDP-L-myo-inositol myo-inositolphosphotransferase
MVGVVLAAGRSERLSRLTKGRSKALAQIGGVSLVERAVRTLAAAGCRRVVVVVGPQGDLVARAARLASVPVEVVRAEDRDSGNGASLAAAQEAVGDEDLLLLCGDHIFSSGALDPLLRERAPAALVDPAPAAAAWDEGTRVHVEEGCAAAFGKRLDDPVIDCGVFVLPPDVFAAQQAAASEEDYSLAGAVTRLAGMTPVRAVPIEPDAWWQDVDTPDDLHRARTLVRRSLVKPSDGPISQHLNRPISTRITMALAPLRLPPDFLTMVALAVGLWAAWWLSAGRALVGALLIQAASVLDGIDGETARLQGRSSERGALLDGLCDRMVDAAMVAGLWLWFWDDPSRPFRLEIILMAMIGWGGLALAAKRPLTNRLEFEPGERRPLSVLIGGRDARTFLVAVICLFHQPVAAFMIGGIVYCSSFLRRLFLLARNVDRSPPSRVAPPDQVGDSAQRDLEEIG